MFSVTYGGRMQPCTQLKIASVNLREEDFSNAWQMTRVAVEGYRRSEECRSCEFFGQCAFCAARYSLRSGGDGKALGAVPCNKKKSMLIPILMKKTKGENKDEKRV